MLTHIPNISKCLFPDHRYLLQMIDLKFWLKSTVVAMEVVKPFIAHTNQYLRIV